MPTFQVNQEFAKVGYPYATWYVDRMSESGAVGVYTNEDGSVGVDHIYGPLPEQWYDPKYDIGFFFPGYDYYITMEQARVLIPLGIGVIRYRDDYNQEYSDYFVCNTKLNKPNYPATVPQPIE